MTREEYLAEMDRLDLAVKLGVLSWQEALAERLVVIYELYQSERAEEMTATG
jgi:hypothetical protein